MKKDKIQPSAISQQNLLLYEVHQLSSGPSYNPCDLYRLHWTKRNSDEDMVTVRKYDVISFEFQAADIHLAGFMKTCFPKI